MCVTRGFAPTWCHGNEVGRHGGVVTRGAGRKTLGGVKTYPPLLVHKSLHSFVCLCDGDSGHNRAECEVRGSQSRRNGKR